jgi:hypothetical protein
LLVYLVNVVHTNAAFDPYPHSALMGTAWIRSSKGTIRVPLYKTSAPFGQNSTTQWSNFNHIAVHFLSRNPVYLHKHKRFCFCQCEQEQEPRIGD